MQFLNMWEAIYMFLSKYVHLPVDIAISGSCSQIAQNYQRDYTYN